MSTSDTVEEAIEVLQQLGLKEYEAKCFVGLSRTSTGTAKKLSEITDVPRTRVYDAIRVLEAQGLVEVQHSNPMQFRAVPIAEATETLRDQYETRVERLADALDEVEAVETDEGPNVQEVWSMSGAESVENRTNELVDDAAEEVVMVVGTEAVLSEELIETLCGTDDGVDLFVGAATDPARERLREAVPSARTILTGLEWLCPDGDGDARPDVGRLVLVDRSQLLASSIVPDTGVEQAIVGQGYTNGLVVVARRLATQGLLTTAEPSEDTQARTPD